MVECRRVDPSRLIIPVFFDVEPSDVRNQKGPFLSAFQRRENNEMLKKEVTDWKNALCEVGEISGFNLKDANRHDEGDLIMCILEKIKEVIPKYLFTCDYPTDLNCHVNEVIKRLDRKVRMVGICRIGGIEKTTLAKAQNGNGIVVLQKHLLDDVRGREVLRGEVIINNKDKGITMIRE
ncbi:hypothetical protein EJ110_NYTH18263 [Nymphaea thermarum]|nr:hypothetical protein EJ110_NYTH18263 [Nymphaea thermarum]